MSGMNGMNREQAKAKLDEILLADSHWVKGFVSRGSVYGQDFFAVIVQNKDGLRYEYNDYAGTFSYTSR